MHERAISKGNGDYMLCLALSLCTSSLILKMINSLVFKTKNNNTTHKKMALTKYIYMVKHLTSILNSLNKSIKKATNDHTLQICLIR